jgi:hypothetical protein
MQQLPEVFTDLLRSLTSVLICLVKRIKASYSPAAASKIECRDGNYDTGI